MGRPGLRIVWVGHHLEGIDALKALIDSNAGMVGVVTLDEESRRKRSGALDYSSLLSENTCPLFEISDINSLETLDLLRSLKPDLILVIGWNQILSTEVLQTARIGIVGAHASLLPHNRGSAPQLSKGRALPGTP